MFVTAVITVACSLLGSPAVAATAATLQDVNEDASSAFAASSGVWSSNMNPGLYTIANSHSHVTDYHQHEYFEVYSPTIATRYSEVYWRMQEAVPLPENIIARFANGGIMAVTGYEVDQVRIEPQTGKEVPVPITWAYNHHYGAFLQNTKKTKMVQRPVMTPFLHHGKDQYWAAEFKNEDQDTNRDDVATEIPLSQFFSEANGGEFRLSYHGYPSGYAQLIESPDTFISFPMQIDTWNRGTNYSQFKPGAPLPKSSRIPNSAGYSGLIECPCTDRLKKEWRMTYALKQHGDAKAPACTGNVQNATECWEAAVDVVPAPKMTTAIIQDKSMPKGCAIVQESDGSVQAMWNAETTQTSTHQKTSVSSETQQWVAFSSNAPAQVNVTVALDKQKAKITITGPNKVWMGVAFGTDSMCIHAEADECPAGGPYAIVLDKESGLHERKLDFHGPGHILDSSLTLVSDTVMDESRTIVITRPLQGLTEQHYSFDSQTRSIPIIAAKGCSLDFAKHCGHGPSHLNFLAVDQVTPVCQAGISGKIGGAAFPRQRCAEAPYSDLIAQHNPTCHVQTYTGGLSCCRHGQPLLDTDQDVPWQEQVLEYRLKFRFYFQEYKPRTAEKAASHHSLVRLYWQTEYHAGEYDIEQCAPEVPRDQCVHLITSRWKVSDMMLDCSVRPDASWCTGKGSKDTDQTQGVKLIYAAPHCHAPSCLSMELYNADTGQLLCHVEPTVGKGDAQKTYDESGFLSIPPCLWGDEKEGLASPQLLTVDTTLLSLKRNNSTLGHTGEMASWQMRGIVVPTAAKEKKNLETLGGKIAETDEERRGQLRRRGS